MPPDLLNIRANLEVRDVSASIDFYRQVLGLEPVVTMGEPPDFALVGTGSASMGLNESSRPAVAGIVACYVDVADVQSAFERCVAAGAAVTMPLTTHPWQMRDFVLRDPDGHQIAVGQRLAG